MRHRRFSPHPHEFDYRLFMLYLDLDEVDAVMAQSRWWSADRPNLAEFRRSDYLGPPERPLADAVRDVVEEKLGVRPGGAVRILTHGRYFGHCFNPVSFYYLFEGDALHSIVAEITNTPWQERHRYVMPISEGEASAGSWSFRFPKRFHVSPFLDMDMKYLWRFSQPGGSVLVHMENLGDQAERAFDATLKLDREPISRASLGRVLRNYPLMTMKVVAGIHWQALKLWLKRNPVYDHPSKRTGH